MKRFIPIPMLFAVWPVSAQIPTIDSASLAQMTASVTQLKSQLAQQELTYSSLTGTRGLGSVANNTALRNYLPTTWQSTYDSVRSGGYSGLTDSAELIRQQNLIYDACSAKTGDAKTVCERSSAQAAQQKAYITGAYSASNERLTQIEQLMGEINSTTDQKSIAELQARIAAEQAAIQNEQTKLNLFKEAAAAEEKLAAQQKKEQVQRMMTMSSSDAKSLLQSF